MNPLQGIKKFLKSVAGEPGIEDSIFGTINWESYWWYVNCIFAPKGQEIGV